MVYTRYRRDGLHLFRDEWIQAWFDTAFFNMLVPAGRHHPISPLPVTETLVHYLGERGATVDLRLHDGGHEVRLEEMTAIAAFLKRKD